MDIELPMTIGNMMAPTTGSGSSSLPSSMEGSSWIEGAGYTPPHNEGVEEVEVSTRGTGNETGASQPAQAQNIPPEGGEAPGQPSQVVEQAGPAEQAGLRAPDPFEGVFSNFRDQVTFEVRSYLSLFGAGKSLQKNYFSRIIKKFELETAPHEQLEEIHRIISEINRGANRPTSAVEAVDFLTKKWNEWKERWNQMHS